MAVARALPGLDGAATFDVKRGQDLVRLGTVKLRSEGAPSPKPASVPIAGKMKDPATRARDGPAKGPTVTPVYGPTLGAVFEKDTDKGPLPFPSAPDTPEPTRKVAALKPPNRSD